MVECAHSLHWGDGCGGTVSQVEAKMDECLVALDRDQSAVDAAQRLLRRCDRADMMDLSAHLLAWLKVPPSHYYCHQSWAHDDE